jgi:hypothetical protein
LCDKIPALIGFGGANTKYIYETTSVKVRIRGRNSGHKEEARCRCGIPFHKKKNGIYKDDALCTCKPTDACIMEEVDIPLQMALSAEGPRRLAEALGMARALLDLHEVRYVVGEVRGPRDELDRLERMCVDGVVQRSGSTQQAQVWRCLPVELVRVMAKHPGLPFCTSITCSNSRCSITCSAVRCS